MSHRILLVVLSLSACGLERDWERWQQASMSGTGDTTAGESSSSTSTSGSDGSDSSGGSDSSAAVGDGDSGTTLAGTTGTSVDASTSSASTTGVTPFCGDGHVDPELGEECDDGDPNAPKCVLCQRVRLIYLTSTLLQGASVNGLQGADAWCRSLAVKAQQELPDSPIVDPGNFKALLSTSTVTIADRHFFGKGPYQLVNGLPVSDSFAALFSEPHHNPINVNERSETMHTYAWTGTDVDGSPYPGIDFCGDWHDDWGSANQGRTDEVDGGWIDYESEFNPTTDCTEQLPIYCVEQE